MDWVNIFFSIGRIALILSLVALSAIGFSRSVYFKHQKNGQSFDMFSPLKHWERISLVWVGILWVVAALGFYLGLHFR